MKKLEIEVKLLLIIGEDLFWRLAPSDGEVHLKFA